MSKVTVALLTYNRAKYLRKAIDSILNQSFKEFEFLICNNGSTDGTEEVIKSYSDSRISYLKNSKNEREFYNIPFSKAKGEYLLITHDDDIMHKDFLQKEVNALENDPNLVAVACNIAYIDEYDNVTKEKIFSIASPHFIRKNEFLNSFFIKYVNLPCPTVLMRKDFFLKNNLKFDLSVGPGADIFLWFNVSKHPVTMCVLDEVLYSYRVHSRQDSQINDLDLHIQLYEALFKEIKNDELYRAERMIIVEKLIECYYSKFKQRKIRYRDYKKGLSNIELNKNDNFSLVNKLLVYKNFPKTIQWYFATRKKLSRIKNKFLHTL